MADYMGRDIMGWAKVLSAASFFLLLMFAVAWSSASEDSEKYLDPLQFNEAVVGPGESISVNLSSSSILGQREYLALRIVEDSEPGPDLRLVLDSEDCEWNEPGILHVDRQLDSNSPKFMIVRVFTPSHPVAVSTFPDFGLIKVNQSLASFVPLNYFCSSFNSELFSSKTTVLSLKMLKTVPFGC